MNERALTELLQDADANAAPPVLPLVEVLTETARRRVQRQAHAQKIAGALFVVAIVASCSIWLTLENRKSPRRDGQQSARLDSSPLRARLAVLTKDADDRLSAANAMSRETTRRARASEVTRQLTGSRTLDDLAASRERAAYTLLLDARKWNTSTDKSDLTLQRIQTTFNQIVTLFPETAAARVARKELHGRKQSNSAKDTTCNA